MEQLRNRPDVLKALEQRMYYMPLFKIIETPTGKKLDFSRTDAKIDLIAIIRDLHARMTALEDDFLWCIEHAGQLDWIRGVKVEMLEKYFPERRKDMAYCDGGERIAGQSTSQAASSDHNKESHDHKK